MKRIYKIITIVVIFGLFSFSVAANEIQDDYISEFDKILPDGYESLAGVEENSLVGIDAVISIIADGILGERGALGTFFLLLIGILTLSHLSSFYSGPLSDTAGDAVAIVSSILILNSLYPTFLSAMDTVKELSSFFALAVPIMTGITLSGGGVSTAAVEAVGMNFTVSIIGALASGAFVSLAAFAFSVSLVSSFGDESAASLLRGLRSLVGWLIGILTTLFLGTLSLQTVISSARDGAAIRAAKYAAQGIIPIVGGTVSGALSTLVGGLSYAKDIVGSGAVTVLLLSSLSPLVIMLFYRLVLSLVASFADTLSATAVTRTLSAFRFATDTVIVIYSLSVLTYIFEIILFMKGGVGPL